ncbi:tRNA glutamyl-Q(34) synthetase GluQRS [uncultured Roseobacter sp.]|uniref:tRNA glutamyl-Q(34) synthetase GluQRS n=1 Tax=uncultured Roseobacter sp. TaxID=114847 RepID=UPI0026078690|nr:tRNA glutamyl-Q(34) synthetase GluQRS [uncultured Roseobacter sp.]
MIFRTRFAPSPTGPLHLGHAFSALTAFDMARAAGGTFLLRMDDIDRVRSKPEYETQAKDDLRWLGVRWPEPVMQQSRSEARFRAALDQLNARGLIYPCSCSRADIEAAVGAPQEGVPTHGPDGRIYPGTCRGRSMAAFTAGDAIRLDLQKAIMAAGSLPEFTETGGRFAGTHRLDANDLLTTVGDITVARREMAAAYHLCVVVDDHAQDITHVIRGEDLFDATRIHVLLADLLALPIPLYHHHRLIRDEAGKRLAKRDDARALALYRAQGKSPADIRTMLDLPPA